MILSMKSYVKLMRKSIIPYRPKYCIIKIGQADQRDDVQHGEGADRAHLGVGVIGVNISRYTFE